ncbi:bifunctional glycosyltransferase family 2 protein/CDP-glycerol:glycerophosphate glycerophosphotransferase [Streptomyces sp. NBC_00638]|uniref:bifunctional glycosyltransferase/CDP-glycerol:glycerophosphate glycerophosphotransferase n=1 Tax=Streptomyces sp. NBC_00638 TaxID=2975794 RepID=UPI002253EF16|nr:bifunctional glycosyltransferase family 2 protein/CDP-glycerol:glycerophosphate glycerophosphotransferase [Streptomyces sp. NBC_00638]MCX5004224.1 bifunctional glycosyltransferase family 2 protein/CDP-glycerol:glycerophosphate glycerophosphotransferase [Streptomyces sp. NBC_00638]
MPRFSVIVPAYKVQAYLHECLESVLGQSYPDLELIAVDDCSPDACGAIIDEFAARDARVLPVHLPENVGLGRARNAGLERATGDYLIFLDSDDSLTPDALHAIADRLKETDEPDVLVYDYARTYWSGEVVRNQVSAQLTEEGPAPFRLEERPGLLRLLMVVWNKAYRREFVERAGLAFPPGYYEDTPWTYPALMSAETIATLDRVCVHYRQRRHGSILGTSSRKHFDVFAQYDRVFAHVDAHPELDRWRPVLFRRMVDHLSTVFVKRGRLPRGARAEFLRKARAHYRRYRVPGGVPAGGGARLRHALVRFGAHRTYRLLSFLSRTRKRALRLSTGLLRGARGAVLQFHYRVQLRLPLRADRAVFSSYWGRGHGCNPGALESAFRTFAPHVRTAWIAHLEHHHTVPAATRRVRPGTAGYWTALARSKYLVNNVNFDRRLVKRPGQIMIQTQHGTPLKRMGLDLQDRPAAARGTDFAELLRGTDKWDYCLSANRHSTLVWERAFPSSYTTLEYGMPRNDVFLKATSADVARLRETLGIPAGAIAVLYAPTYRDYRSSRHGTLDLDRVLRRLGPRFVVLTRAHPTFGAPLPDTAGGRVIDVSGHPSIESLCLASDALVTDYSSLMFDYAGLDRPIVVHADDWEAYEAARGTYFDLRAFPPGAVARSEDELIDIFATGHWRGSRSSQLRAAFRERFCPYDDGRAAERVVRRVVLGETAGLPPFVPFAERHPVPSAAAALPRAAGSAPPQGAPAAAPRTTVPAPGGAVPLTETL